MRMDTAGRRAVQMFVMAVVAMVAVRGVHAVNEGHGDCRGSQSIFIVAQKQHGTSAAASRELCRGEGTRAVAENREVKISIVRTHQG